MNETQVLADASRRVIGASYSFPCPVSLGHFARTPNTFDAIISSPFKVVGQKEQRIRMQCDKIDPYQI